MFVGSTCEVERYFFWVKHFALIVTKGFKGKLGTDGEQKSIVAYLIQFFLDCGQYLHKFSILLLEFLQIPSFLNQILIHLNHVVIHPHLLGQFLPERWDHAQRLQIQPESLLGKFLFNPILELPEILNAHRERFLHTFLEDEVDKRIAVGLETNESLGYLVTV